MTALLNTDIEKFTNSLIEFIQNSPTPFHAAKNMSEILKLNGFKRLDEVNEWNIEPQKGYYVTRNGSSIMAFRTGINLKSSDGFRLIGAHVDSPCLKLTPNPDIHEYGYKSSNVEIYGSPLLRTWFDRDLSVAGRVYYRDNKGNVRRKLIDLVDPVAVIPSIAIHLDRKANVEQNINRQHHLNPVCSIATVDSKNQSPILELIVEQLGDVPGLGTNAITGFDLSFYDVNPPAIVGAEKSFLASARIDNLLSCYAGLRALIDVKSDSYCGLICNDHEEVGSVSDAGAQGPFLRSVLERTTNLDARKIRRSMLISADGAHGIHPNYPEKHDAQHSPVLNCGPVIKLNSNQNYATTGELISFLRTLCEPSEIPLQTFVSRNDLPCGTTIGPITSAELGIKTIDIGVAQFAMHSIRELTGIKDVFDFYRLLSNYLGCKNLPG